MPDAEAAGRLVRHGAMLLDGDDVIGRLTGPVRKMRVQLVKGFAADAAVAAVLEDEYRALSRLGNSRFERSNIRKGLHSCHVGAIRCYQPRRELQQNRNGRLPLFYGEQ